MKIKFFKGILYENNYFYNLINFLKNKGQRNLRFKILNRFVKKNNDFIRMYTAGVKSIDLDSNGRLLVPKDLISISKLTKNVVLSSSINIIEIWDKDEYEKSINNPKVDFAKLTEEVMGNDQDNVS